MSRLNKGLAFLWGWAIIVIAVVGSIRFFALDPSFYTSRYERMGMAEDLRVSEADLDDAIVLLLDYIEGDVDSLDQTITINGTQRETFNEREKSHMVDVRNLYLNAVRVQRICMILAVVLSLRFVFLRHALSFLTQGFIRSILCLLVLFVFFGTWIAIDFTAFWNWFHTLFFSNDLWLLNPATDFMINMLPETIFYQLVLWCVCGVLVVLVPCLCFSIYYQRKKAPIGFADEDHSCQPVTETKTDS